MDTKNTFTTPEAEDWLRRIRYLGQILIVPEDDVPIDSEDEWGDQDHEIIVIR